MATKTLKIVKTGPEISKTALFYTFAADIPIIMKTVQIRGKWVSGLARMAPVTASAETSELAAQRTGALNQSTDVPDNLKTWFDRLQERFIPLFLRPAIDCGH
jgi:hypothetical protein